MDHMAPRPHNIEKHRQPLNDPSPSIRTSDGLLILPGSCIRARKRERNAVPQQGVVIDMAPTHSVMWILDERTGLRKMIDTTESFITLVPSR
jgi:hypothetical protein